VNVTELNKQKDNKNECEKNYNYRFSTQLMLLKLLIENEIGKIRRIFNEKLNKNNVCECCLIVILIIYI